MSAGVVKLVNCGAMVALLGRRVGMEICLLSCLAGITDIRICMLNETV
jgi:hypothetical protein